MPKDFIDAADQFGVVNVKLAMEFSLVQRIYFDLGNVTDWLLFADSNTCPLLKEHAVSYIMANAADYMESSNSKKLKESPKLMEELMFEIISNSANRDSRMDSTGNNCTVNDLRKMLHKEGLDLNGSKEMLVARLENSKKRKKTE
ncbi:hypothetical protein ACHAWF_013415 [Thalassiosira exigua]